jgi:hypothetical protein
MKGLLSFFLLCSSISAWACSAQSHQASVTKQIPNPTSSPVSHNETETSYLPENEEIVDRSGDIQMIFMGNLVLKNDGIISKDSWSLGENSGEMEIKKGLTFDLMTCAGFVGQAKLKNWIGKDGESDKGYDWEIELMSVGNFRENKNLLEKCRDDNGYVRTFAVYPVKKEREKIQIKSSPDLETVFDSLPLKEKEWIASNDPEKTGYLEEKKKVPDIEAWTDSDGDGKMDLIEVKGNCNGQPDGDLICMQILHFARNKWIRVGWLATD